MTSKILFQDPSGFATPLLVVFAVDIATGKDDPPSPALLTTSDALRGRCRAMARVGRVQSGARRPDSAARGRTA